MNVTNHTNIQKKVNHYMYDTHIAKSIKSKKVKNSLNLKKVKNLLNLENLKNLKI